MLNPANLSSSSSYFDVQGRVLRRLRSEKINDQIFEVVQSAYEKALARDGLILSRVERERLLAYVLKSVLSDMNRKLGGD